MGCCRKHLHRGWVWQSRVAKFDRNGEYIKSWGGRGDAAGTIQHPHSIVVDAKDNVYVADRGNKRIQVFDTDGNLKTQYAEYWFAVGFVHHFRAAPVSLLV